MSTTNCPPWEGEKSEQLPHVVSGLREFYRFIIDACRRHHVITHGDLKTNHRKVFDRVVPIDYYAGNYRGTELGKPCLAVNVQVDGASGEHFDQVTDAMKILSETVRMDIASTDDFVRHTASPVARARATCQLAASIMVELIRIHPFINGNGRMGRMVVNYIFKRYGYEMPFTASHIRPPERDYAAASAAAMGPSSDPKPMYLYLLSLFARSVTN